MGGSIVVEPSTVPFIPDLIEAYAQAGMPEEAALRLGRFKTISEEAGRTWALAACSRCEGLLAVADEFDEPFELDLHLLEPPSLLLDLARTQLAYGERLRRQRRRRDARVHLRAAYDAFALAGAAAGSSAQPPSFGPPASRLQMPRRDCPI